MDFWDGDDRDDLDNVLFGGSDPPGDGSFDPFLPGIGQEGSEMDGDDGDIDSPTDDYGDNDLGRILRFSSQVASRQQSDDDQSLPWERGTNQPTKGEGSARDRAAADTGDRNVRRIADVRGGGATTGILRREQSEGVANSISDAQRRIRANATIPLDETEQVAAVKNDEAGHYKKITRHYERQSISRPPEFRSANFEATMMALKANATGDWILQVKVPAEFKSAVFDLGDAYGLALDITVARKSYSRDES